MYVEDKTGTFFTIEQIKSKHSQTSFSKIIPESTLEELGYVMCTNEAQPTLGKYQYAWPNDKATKGSDGKWTRGWTIKDVYSDIEGGKTKEEQEADADAAKVNELAKNTRIIRNEKLAETDWWASSDLTMTSEQIQYRKALRDLPTHSSWPDLKDSDWPTKP